MPNNVAAGMAGQQTAEQYLLNKGWRILARNYRAPSGEIDLIALDEPYIVFIEVKYRTGLQYGYPREAVHKSKQKRIKKTALFYIAGYQLSERDFRFDVIELLNESGVLSLNHIENAFM